MFTLVLLPPQNVVLGAGDTDLVLLLRAVAHLLDDTSHGGGGLQHVGGLAVGALDLGPDFGVVDAVGVDHLGVHTVGGVLVVEQHVLCALTAHALLLLVIAVAPRDDLVQLHTDLLGGVRQGADGEPREALHTDIGDGEVGLDGLFILLTVQHVELVVQTPQSEVHEVALLTLDADVLCGGDLIVLLAVGDGGDGHALESGGVIVVADVDVVLLWDASVVHQVEVSFALNTLSRLLGVYTQTVPGQVEIIHASTLHELVGGETGGTGSAFPLSIHTLTGLTELSAAVSDQLGGGL